MAQETQVPEQLVPSTLEQFLTIMPPGESPEADQAIISLITDPDARANPYPVYARLREIAPVYQNAFFWFVTSYDACDKAVHHPALVRRHGEAWEIRAQVQGSAGRRWFEAQEQSMLWLDPPDHGRIRGLVSKAFTPRYIERLRPRVEALVNESLDRVAEMGKADLIADFAFQLPLQVICEMLGIPTEDRESFRKWTVAIAAVFEPFPSAPVQDRADEATDAFEAYFNELIPKRRENPGEDLLSRMIQAEDEGNRLTHEELIASATLLLGAGFETTTNLIGNGTYALLKNRDQWELLVDEPGLAKGAVEELLRYDSPVQIATPRVAKQPIEIDGKTIGEAETVLAVTGAGNRDPAQYEDPDRLDIRRQNIDPLSFGGGPHFCLGAALARLEGAIAFEAMARKIPNLELAAEPTYRPTLNIRGLNALEVTV
ncbi:MAG: cytochrome P450 [Actinomycetota bacterium]|nr:cytochrome P450 [Actinomycetota bacterium]